MGGYQVELSPLDSFCYFCKILWTPDLLLRAKIPILDTIIYNNGKPQWWIFTSRKTGEIMKKRTEKLSSPVNVVNSFKKLLHTYGGQKAQEVKTKIANVWYLNSHQGLSSYLVDEMELTNLLNTTTFEIIAIQSYIGGYKVKGNGIFEHRINKLTTNGTVKYQSLENCDVEELQFSTLQLTLKTKHLIILERQHEILKSLGTILTRHIEGLSRAKVSQIAFQAVFNSTWTPFLVSLKSVTFTEAPNSFFDSREACIYLFGKAPSVPIMHERSLLLPSGIEYNSNNEHVFRQKKSLNSHSSTYLNNTKAYEAKGKAARPLSGETVKVTTNSRPSSAGATAAARTVISAINTDNNAETNSQRNADVNAERLSEDFLRQHNLTGDAHKVEDQQTQAMNKCRPQSAPTYTIPSNMQTMQQTATSPMVTRILSTGNLNLSAAHSATNPNLSSQLHVGTELSHNRIKVPHIQNQEADDTSSKELHTFFAPRRPISAPHASLGRRKRPDSALSALTANSNTTVNIYDEGEQKGTKNVYLHKELPLSGGCCFGDYCQFIDQVTRHIAHYEDGGGSSDKGEDQPIQGKKNRQSDSELTRTGFAYSGDSTVRRKAFDCPYRLAQKSISLARTEVKFINQPLEDKINSWVLRVKLSQMDPSQLYAYFVRRHINSVAQRCQEEARKIAMQVINTPMDMWEDLNIVYRRLIYSQALSQIHASRFYYTVPVCESCYKVYTFMDEQREQIILHNPEQSKALGNPYNKLKLFKKKQSKGDDSLEVDMNNIFNRLYYNPNDPYKTRPRSAPSHTGNKTRLSKLLGENAIEAQSNNDNQVSGDKDLALGAKDDEEKQDEGVSLPKRRASKAIETTNPKEKLVSANESKIKNTEQSEEFYIIQDNITEMKASNKPRPQPNTIFSYVHSAPAPKQETNKNNSKNTSKLPPKPPVSYSRDEKSYTYNAKSNESNGDANNYKLASIYGYSTLPFEEAPQLSLRSHSSSQQGLSSNRSHSNQSPSPSRFPESSPPPSSHFPDYPSVLTPVIENKVKRSDAVEEDKNGSEETLFLIEMDPSHPSDVKLLAYPNPPAMSVIQEEGSEEIFDSLIESPTEKRMSRNASMDAQADEAQTPVSMQSGWSMEHMDYSQSLSPLSPLSPMVSNSHR